MALRTGTGGFIEFADVTGLSISGTPAARKMKITRWSLDIPIEEGDVTGFQPTDNIVETIPGDGEIRGTFEGSLDDTNLIDQATLIDPEAASALIVLQYNRTAPTGADVAQQVSFQGWLSNVAVGVRPGDPNSVAGAFMGTGAPTWAKATLS